MLAYEALAAISMRHLKRMLYRRFGDASADEARIRSAGPRES
jgi:hypothetical protein